MDEKNTATAPETTESTASETTEVKAKKQMTKSGAFIVALSVVLLLGVVCTMLSAVRKQYESELDATYESMTNSLFALRNLISFEDSLQSSYESFDLREAKIFTDVAKAYFDYNGVTKATLSDYAYRMGDCEIFFYPDAGGELTSDNAGAFDLDETRMRILKTVGTVETEDHDYTAVRLDGGWLCFRWENAQEIYSVDFERILETCPSALFAVETATGAVIASSDGDAYDFLNQELIDFDAERTAHASDGIAAGFLGGGALSGGVYFVKLQIIDRYTLFAYTPLRTVAANALRAVAPEFGLMLLIFVFIWFCAMRMRRQGESIQDQEQCQQFTKDYYINLPVARHTATLLIIGLVMTAAISIHLPLLTSYTKHNAKTENNLNSFVSEMQLSDEEWDKIDDIFFDLVTDRAMMLAEMKAMMGDDFGAEKLTEIARDMDFVSVVVYDDSGTAVMSTDSYIGYTLSQNAEDDEFALWALLNNADVSLMREKHDGSGYFVAVRRLDAPGVICATLTSGALSAMREQTDINEVLLRVNTDTYAKMYTSAADTDTLLWATTSSDKVRSIPNNLPEGALLARYCGMQRIGGNDYYLNTMSDDEHIIISAEHNETLTRPVLGILARIIPVSLVLALAILLMSSVYREIDDWLKDDYTRILTRVFSSDRGTVKKEDTELDETLKKMLAWLIGLVFAALIILYIFDAIFAPNPVSAYLFSNQREHRPGIFSLTTILLSVGYAVIGIAMLKKLLGILSGRMDSRAKTISDLIESIVRFVTVLFLAIYSLYQVGVNTSVILTSAGVLSLIIGYGSQSIVSDLVSGLFLIMEDQVRIGELIEVDGFWGTVTHIGLRTTTAKYYNRVKVVNNSKMAGFYNLSRDTAAAHFAVGVSVDQDIDTVRDIIMNNKERFEKELGELRVLGPIYTGVDKVNSDYQGHNVFLHFLTVGPMSTWMQLRARSLEIACKLLAENGVEPTGGELFNV